MTKEYEYKVVRWTTEGLGVNDLEDALQRTITYWTKSNKMKYHSYVPCGDVGGWLVFEKEIELDV